MGLCDKLAGILCEYKSVRFIRVRNVKLATIYYLLMLFVLVYVVAFTIVWDKGYQATDEVTGTTSAKLKGTGCIGNYTNFEDFTDLTVLDAMDLVVPSMEENAFFITTAQTATPNQTRTFCDGNDNVPICTIDNTTMCEQEFFSPESEGIFTGACGTNNRCEMYSWCPLENDTNVDIIHNIGEFTVFVKIDVSFDRFGVDRGNTYDRLNTSAPEFGYNLFTIDDIISNATNGGITSYYDVAERGAIILISSVWNCNLDNNINECNPRYTMTRIDDEPDTISTGYNFRTVEYDTNEQFRFLKKLYGIRVIFICEGRAGRFDWAALTVTFGAGLAYLGIASVIADVVMENFLRESKHYVANKLRAVGKKGSLASATNEMDTYSACMETGLNGNDA
eukprot:314071_1